MLDTAGKIVLCSYFILLAVHLNELFLVGRGVELATHSVGPTWAFSDPLINLYSLYVFHSRYLLYSTINSSEVKLHSFSSDTVIPKIVKPGHPF